MSTDLSPTNSPQLAMTAAHFGELLKRPFLALPPALRPAAFSLWACHSHLPGLASALPITASVATWLNAHDLHPADAEAIMRGMLAPGRMAKFGFAGELISALAAAATEATDRRRRLAEQEARRRDAAAADADRASPEDIARVRDLLAVIVRPPNE